VPELLKGKPDRISRMLQPVATGAKTCDLLLAFRPKIQYTSLVVVGVRKFASASLFIVAVDVFVPSPEQNKFCFPHFKENPPCPGKLVSIVAFS
jgi:hypothetical protein